MSSRSTLGTIKRVVAILLAIAIVLAAGVIVGQAPAIFGVEEDPEASITFEDQEGDGSSVVVDEVRLSDGGFVVITDDDGERLVVSEYLSAGSHENVTVERDEAGPELLGSLTATVHQDTTGDEEFAYEATDGEEDRPYLEDGFPVSDTASVTPASGDQPAIDSIVVDSLEVPPRATTDETITVVAELSNPTDFALQGPVEFRVDGVLIEQRTVDLGSGETEEVSADIDTRGLEPGERTIGVYTDADGALETVELEFHTDPVVIVTDASTGGVTADVAIPARGFLAIEDNGTEATLGTSDELDAGEHANVTVAFDENVSVDRDDELRAVLYEGDPDDPDVATLIEHDDEPVRTVFAIETVDEAADDEDGADGGGDGDDEDGADGGDGDDGADEGDEAEADDAD